VKAMRSEKGGISAIAAEPMPERSHPLRSLWGVDELTGQDYAEAVSAERGRCFRFVYDEHGKPDRCPAPVTRVGWLYLAYERKWHPVDSCKRHVSQLEQRPSRVRVGSGSSMGPSRGRPGV
jgi:hypothetical protein